MNMNANANINKSMTMTMTTDNASEQSASKSNKDNSRDRNSSSTQSSSWTKRFSSKFERHYWKNEATGEKTWISPLPSAVGQEKGSLPSTEKPSSPEQTFTL